MRGVPLEVFEVNTRLELPSNLRVGALYFVKDDLVIKVNHGGGKITEYGFSDLNDIPGILMPPKGGVGTLDVAGKFVAVEGDIVDLQTRDEQIQLELTTTKNELSGRINGNTELIHAVNTTLSEDIENEAEARTAADALLNSYIESVLGKLRYLPAFNFGTATPIGAVLTQYAKDHTGMDTVANSTSVVNLFDGHEWVYNTTGNSWVNMGDAAIFTATNTSLGVVKGDAVNEGGVTVDINGNMSFPLASASKRGGIRAELAPDYSGPWSVVVGMGNSKGFIANLTDALFAGLQAAASPSAANPIATMQDINDARLRWNGGVDSASMTWVLLDQLLQEMQDIRTAYDDASVSELSTRINQVQTNLNAEDVTLRAVIAQEQAARSSADDALTAALSQAQTDNAAALAAAIAAAKIQIQASQNATDIALSNNIAALQTSLNTTQTELTTLQTDVANINVAGIETDLTALRTQLDALQENVDTHNAETI